MNSVVRAIVEEWLRHSGEVGTSLRIYRKNGISIAIWIYYEDESYVLRITYYDNEWHITKERFREDRAEVLRQFSVHAPLPYDFARIVDGFFRETEAEHVKKNA